MGTLHLHLEDIGHSLRFGAALLAVLGVTLTSAVPSPVAEAKGPVTLTFCGERACLGTISTRFAAAMLYGGRLHAGPACDARVHTVTIGFKQSSERLRFLLRAPSGLIGQQGRGGYVWWRKVRGSRQADLVRAVRGTGPGFTAERGFTAGAERHSEAAEVQFDAFGSSPSRVARWRLRENYTRPGQVTCRLAAAPR